jgi:hypothetical protein
MRGEVNIPLYAKCAAAGTSYDEFGMKRRRLKRCKRWNARRFPDKRVIWPIALPKSVSRDQEINVKRLTPNNVLVNSYQSPNLRGSSTSEQVRMHYRNSRDKERYVGNEKIGEIDLNFAVCFCAVSVVMYRAVPSSEYV